MRRSPALALVVLLAASPSSAGDPKAESRAAFEEGSKAFDQGRVKEALSLYQKAYALFPHPLTLFNLGLAHRALGNSVEAVDALEKFLADPSYKATKEQRKTAKDIVDQESKRIATLTLKVSPGSARVEVDGKAVREGSLRVNAGAHQVVVTAEGHEDAKRTYEAKPGESIVVDLALKARAAPGEAPPIAKPEAPPPEASREPSKGQPPLFWGGVAAAGVGLVVMGVSGTLALREQKTWKDASTSDADADQAKKRGTTYRTLADVGLVVAVAGGVTALVVRRKDTNGTALRLRTGPGSFVVDGRF